MKKVFGFILAFMVLSFSGIPCADDISMNNKEVKYDFPPSIPLDNEQDHNDGCSPFCICSCCAGFSVVAKLPSTPKLIISYQTTFSLYIPQKLFSIALPIWQPPQLI